MGPWREAAERYLPELATKAWRAETPYLLWFDVRIAFERAYERTPPDESLIRRVYHFARWCVSQPAGRAADDDLGTCVAVCFYEHVPEHPAARRDMPRWFTLEQVDGVASLFRWTQTDEQFAGLRRHLAANRDMFVDGWWNDDPFLAPR